MGPFVFSEVKYHAQVQGVLDEWRRDCGAGRQAVAEAIAVADLPY